MLKPPGRRHVREEVERPESFRNADIIKIPLHPRMTAIAWRSTSAATSPCFTIIKTGTDISIGEPGMEPPIPYRLQDPRITLSVFS
ncbi:hypothetical protein CHY08_27705 (plasmid) [Rhizobium leguminosarum bv. viciae]|nr:hypothetical protein CHY08_27705 [Rhizobium leguminosarum bv. viciae]